jgi:AbiTii
MTKKLSLVEQVERDALDGRASLADALRKCVALGGQAGSEDLRDWASRELQGYEGVSDMPAYRTIVAPIVIDGLAGNIHITGEQISVHDLPEVAQGSISEELVIRQGVGELEELIRAARAGGESVRLGLPGGAELAKLMTYEFPNRFRAVERIYWNVSPIVLVGIVDQIRNRLVALVAEVRAVAPDPASPSGEAVTNAVQVAVYGKARDIHISAPQASGPVSTAVVSASGEDKPWWRRAKVLWSIAVGGATIVGVIIAWLQFK